MTQEAPDLETVILRNCSKIHATSLRALVMNGLRLQFVDVTRCKHLTMEQVQELDTLVPDVDMLDLKNLRNLRNQSLSDISTVWENSFLERVTELSLCL